MHFSFTFFICLEIWWLTDFYFAPHAYRPGADISEASLDPVPANFPNLWRTQPLGSSGWRRNPSYLLMVGISLLLCHGSLQLVVWPSVALPTQSIRSECAHHKEGGKNIYIYIRHRRIEVIQQEKRPVPKLQSQETLPHPLASPGETPGLLAEERV